MRVFVTGGTGMVGSRIVPRLLQRGDTVVLLSRRPEAARRQFGGCTVVAGDPALAGPWTDTLADCDAVIHLAGENLFARRWNDAFKKVLRDSRVVSTQNVVEALARRPRNPDGSPKVLLNASAIGYYGPHQDEELTEDSPPGDDFLARLCVEWEQAARGAEGQGARLALVRIGVVLGKESGALSKLLTPFRMGVGGPVGSGRQWMSWIHQDDLAGLFVFLLENAAAAGPVNGTAPQPVTNRDFSRALGRALHRPAFLPTPRFGLRLLLGEVADVVATGQRVLPKRALELGYGFRFPTIDEALKDLLG
jgi:uncharacterized protein (TIGR01777 family)